jgi:hypothetical protein
MTRVISFDPRIIGNRAPSVVDSPAPIIGIRISGVFLSKPLKIRLETRIATTYDSPTNPQASPKMSNDIRRYCEIMGEGDNAANGVGKPEALVSKKLTNVAIIAGGSCFRKLGLSKPPNSNVQTNPPRGVRNNTPKATPIPHRAKRL